MSTNLPPTAYVKMLDCWLIFSLLKPFVDILVQTFIHTLRDTPVKKVKAWSKKKSSSRIDFCQIFLKIVYPVFFILFILMFWLVGLLYYLIL